MLDRLIYYYESKNEKKMIRRQYNNYFQSPTGKELRKTSKKIRRLEQATQFQKAIEAFFIAIKNN